MNSTITAMHYCVPRKRLGNRELIERFGERQVVAITKMAGIEERRVVSPGETASDLAYWAAVGLLQGRGVAVEEIDLLIFASQTGDYQIPATACVLHGRLGLSEDCAAFDINLGCSSYPYSLSVAHGMVTAGIARRALVLNAEALTTVIHPLDRGLVPLHGDGAVASLVEPTSEDAGLLGFVLGTEGASHQHLIIPASGARRPRSEESKQEITDASGCVYTDEHLQMNGPAIFHFSVRKIPDVIAAAMLKFGVTVDDLDLVILHQANRTMVEQIYRSLGVPEDKRFFFMSHVGNTSGPSSAMALAEAWRQGRVQPGGRTLLVAFGVGLSWGVVLIQWPSDAMPAVHAPTEPGDEAT